MPTVFSYAVTNPEKDAAETFRRLEQDDPTILEMEKSYLSFNNHKSLNSNGRINHRTRTLTTEDGLGSTPNVLEPNEGHINSIGSTADSAQPYENGLVSDGETDEEKAKKLAAVKVILFDSLTSFFGVVVPLFCVIFGFLYIGKCPANSYIPYMVFIIGILSLLAVYCALQKTKSKKFVCLNQMERMRIEAHSGLLQFLWICEVVLFIFMDVSFDASADNYYDPWFYFFTVFMNIFFALGFRIGYCLMNCDPDNLGSCQDFTWSSRM